MNDEQRAILAAIARMEGQAGSLVDEYTVARSANILTADLTGQEYVAAPGREVVRRHFGELEAAGLIRVDRDGFWRPRTTLAGRRVLQGVEPLVAPLRRMDDPEWLEVPGVPPGSTERAAIPTIFPDDDGDDAPAPRGERGWPAWWPAALRIGDPSLTPLVVPIAGIVVLLICVFIGSRALAGRGAAATPTATAVVAVAPSPSPATSAGAAGPSAAGSPTPTFDPLPTRPPTAAPNTPPTPTAKAQSKQVMIVNTDNLGAFLYATPKGERKTLAIPEGIVVEVVGPDERDSTGANWKHVRWADGDYWVPEEYTQPVE